MRWPPSIRSQLPDACAEAAARIAPVVATDRPAWLPDDDAAAAPARRRIARARASSIDEHASDRSRRAHRGSGPHVRHPALEIARALDVRARTRERNPAARVAIVVAEPARAAQRSHRARGGNPVSRAAARARSRTRRGPMACRWASRWHRYRSSPARSTSLRLHAGTSSDGRRARCCARRSCPMPRAQWMRRRSPSASGAENGRRDVGWFDVVARFARIDPTLHSGSASPHCLRGQPRLPREWARIWSDWLQCTRLAGDGDAVECAMAGARRMVAASSRDSPPRVR